MAVYGKILIIDDEEIVRDLLAEVLSDADFQAVTAENGLVALDLFRNAETVFDLVIVDMSMPGMSGPEVCKALRTINPFQKIIIATGNYSTDEEVAELKKNGISQIVRKPFNMGELFSIIDSLKVRNNVAQA